MKKKRKKKRILWSEVNKRISDVQFRIMFRMNRKYFASLCLKIISFVSEKKFKSEAYMDTCLKYIDSM